MVKKTNRKIFFRAASSLEKNVGDAINILKVCGLKQFDKTENINFKKLLNTQQIK